MKKHFLFIVIIGFVATLVILDDSLASEKNATNAIVVPFDSLIKQEKILTGHTGWVGAIAFSSDGRLLASGDDDGLLILWDVATGAKIRKLEQPSKLRKTKNNNLDHLFDSGIMSVSFSPVGKFLVSGRGDGTISLWEVASGKKITDIAATPNHSLIAFSPDGKMLASAGGESHLIILWDITTRKKIATIYTTLDNSESIRHIAFSPNGALLAVRATNKTIVIDLKHGYSKRFFNCFMPDEHILHKYPVSRNSSIAFSPDNKILASGSKNRTLILLDVATGNIVKKFTGHSDAILAVAFSPIGKVIASLSDDATIILWDVVSGKQVKTLSADADSWEITFSGDGKILAASGSNGIIQLWDTTGVNLSGVFSKGEFETTSEYEQRLNRTEIPYSTVITLGMYDADRSLFEAELEGTKFFISLPKDKAAGIADHKDKIRLECKLKYFDADNVELVNPVLVDDVSEERFAILKSIDGPAIAYTPKPAPKETPVENIHDIPDFKSLPRKDDIAVVIGVEHYQSLPNADYSKSDAGIMKDYLKALGFQERNVEFLTDERATKSGIEKSIEAWLPNRVKKDSRVFVYYSGHGAPDPVTGEANLVPYDGDPNYLSVTGYPINRLYDKLGKLQVKEVIIVLDACFSGAGGRSVLAKGTRPLIIVAEGAILNQNMAVLTATQGTQISTSSPEKGHGLLTYYFLKAIKDGKSDIADIYEQIKPQIEDEAKTLNVQQSPSLRPGVEMTKGKFSLRIK